MILSATKKGNPASSSSSTESWASNLRQVGFYIADALCGLSDETGSFKTHSLLHLKCSSKTKTFLLHQGQQSPSLKLQTECHSQILECRPVLRQSQCSPSLSSHCSQGCPSGRHPPIPISPLMGLWVSHPQLCSCS